MGRIKDLTEASKDSLEAVGTTYSGAPIELRYPVSEVVRRMQADARASGFKAPLFEVFSGYRSVELQQKLFDRKREEIRATEAAKLVAAAKAEGKTLTTKQALKKLSARKIEVATRLAVAAPGSSTHQTGAAFDLNLGYPTTFTPENVKAIEATKQYKFMKKTLAPKYKLTQYAPEPWHWECDAECEAHMLSVLEAEGAQTNGMVALKSVALSRGAGVDDIALDDGELSENDRRLLILNYEAEQRNTKLKAAFVVATSAIMLFALANKNRN